MRIRTVAALCVSIGLLLVAGIAGWALSLSAQGWLAAFNNHGIVTEGSLLGIRIGMMDSEVKRAIVSTDLRLGKEVVGEAQFGPHVIHAARSQFYYDPSRGGAVCIGFDEKGEVIVIAWNYTSFRT